MTEYSNENRGSLFKNDKKTEDRHPDMSGSINIDGIEYWISGWKKKSKADVGFISLSVRPKEQTRQSSQPTQKAKSDNWDDDLPF